MHTIPRDHLTDTQRPPCQTAGMEAIKRISREVLLEFMKLLAAMSAGIWSASCRSDAKPSGKRGGIDAINKTAARRPPLPICTMILAIPTHYLLIDRGSIDTPWRQVRSWPVDS